MSFSNIKFKKKWSDNRGVSEVVGTILILAITVVLFSSIMVFVMNMPMPNNTPIADFKATLIQDPTDLDSFKLSLFHNGGESLFNYRTQILIKNDVVSQTYMLNAEGVIAPKLSSNQALPDTLSIGQTWTSPDLNGKFITTPAPITISSKLDVSVVDTEANTMIWSSKVQIENSGSGPIILQRWTDSDISTITPDKIIEGDTGFALYVHVTPEVFQSMTVSVDSSKVPTGNNAPAGIYIGSGLWRFDFEDAIETGSASLWDGKPLYITATYGGHSITETFILEVSASERGPQGEQGKPGPVGPSVDEDFTGGFPSWLKFRNGDQAYIILGEDLTTNPHTPGALANQDDERNYFTQGEWVFIRVGSRLVRNIDATNNLTITSFSSGQKITPPSSSSAFSLFSVIGDIYIWQSKFETSNFNPGGYCVKIQLKTSTPSDGTAPGYFVTTTNLTINPKSGGASVFIPTIDLYDQNRRVYPTAIICGNASTNPFDLSNITRSVIWVEVKLQTISTTSPASVFGVTITDMKGRTNLYGNAPTSDNMISIVRGDPNGTAKYFFSIDLKLRNGVFWTSGLAAYSLTLTKVNDTDESVNLISVALWIKASVEYSSYVAGTNGFGIGHQNFAHFDYLYQIDNNKFYTTKILEGRDESPGQQGSSEDAYKLLYFDYDEDGDRDVMAAFIDQNGCTRIKLFTNRINEYGIWEPGVVFSNHSTFLRSPRTADVVTSMAYGDVDKDGDYDWIIANGTGVYLYINDYPVKTRTIFGANYGFVKMQMADMNGDGRADLIALLNGNLYVYNLTRGSSIISPTSTPVLLTSFTPGTIADFDAKDINNDKITDIMAVYSTGLVWLKTDIYTPPTPVVLANGEIANKGTRVGGNNYVATTASDNTREQVQEANGLLDYGWQTEPILAKWSWSNPTIYIEAHTSAEVPSNGEGFYFWYSMTQTGPRTFMFNMSQTTDTIFSYTLPSGIIGNLWIWVTDANNSINDISQDSVYIDQIIIKGSTGIYFTAYYISVSAPYYTCVGIGNMDGTGYADIVEGSSSGFKIYTGLKTTAPYYTNVYTIPLTQITPTVDTFCVRDVNGDGRDDVVAIAASGTTIRQWINLGSGSSFSEILIKDFTQLSGPESPKTRGQTTPIIRCISVEKMYG